MNEQKEACQLTKIKVYQQQNKTFIGYSKVQINNTQKEIASKKV